jgi:hypothetical protein
MTETRKRLEQLLRRKKILNLPSIAKAMKDRSRRSLFRDLAALGYQSSFTHAGRYYTLTEIPQFDEQGLWFFQGIGFSRAGTLKNTLVELVNAADAGQTHNELHALLHVRVHNALLDLVSAQIIGRERIEKLYLYVNAVAKHAAEQVARRRDLLTGTVDALTKVPVVLVIEVLLELVRAGPVLLTPSVVTKRLGARGISATEDQVVQVFSNHGLTSSKKKPP